MMFKKHKWIILVLTVMCIVVQALVVAPHHHHSESENPCFNIVHCIEHEASHEEEQQQECAHNHCTPEQEPISGHDCLVKIDIAEVVNIREYRTLLDSVTALNDLYVTQFVATFKQDNTLRLFTLTRRRQIPVVPDICVQYLAEAHSPRAPSCLV